ncbi:hypothetical protein [Kitasatospora terrestris]|uniref:hypothetical protein n=1 Tax=Kitasatospora terrestris TaxID=258051 RepID=UPI0031E4F6A2
MAEADKAPAVAAMSAPQVVRTGRQALADAPSFTFNLAVGVRSYRFPTVSVTADRSGHCTGTLAGESRGPVEVRRIGQRAWVKGSADFWKEFEGSQRAAAPARLADRYVLVHRGYKPLDDLVARCDPEWILDFLDENIGGEEQEKVGSTTMNGTDTLQVHSGTPGQGAELYVATTGTPYLVKLARQAGPRASTVSFSAFGEPVSVTEPPAAETVDLVEAVTAAA